MKKLLLLMLISVFAASCYTVVTPRAADTDESSSDSSDTYISGDYINIYSNDNDFWWGRYSHHPRYRHYYWWTDFYYDPYYYDYNYFYDDYYWYGGGGYDYPNYGGYYWGHYGNGGSAPAKKEGRDINYNPRPGSGGRGSQASGDQGGGNSSGSQPTAIKQTSHGNHSGSQNHDHNTGGKKGPKNEGKKISKKPGRRPK